LPVFEKSRKSELLDYELFAHDMPLTNPANIAEKLEDEFEKSKFNSSHSAEDISQ
jgi:lysine 2,3-aminomutase